MRMIPFHNIANKGKAFRKILCILPCILLFFFQLNLLAQSNPDFEEITVWIKIPGIGGFELNGIYSYRNQQLYLPVTDFFSALRINQETLPDYDTIRGFFIDEQNRYIIDYPNRTIRANNTLLKIDPEDLLKTETGLFLNIDFYGKAFGLYCTFNFRTLTVEVKTDHELPAIKEMRRQQIRQNVERLKGVITVDTTIKRQYHLLRFGVVDWSFNSYNVSGERTDTRIIAGLGSEFLFGETNLIVNYSTKEEFQLRNQLYQWRWANNQLPFIRQIKAGKISPNSISSIFNPFNGINISNVPTLYRRSFGSYTLAEYTEPGWTVELFINNVLVDYTIADASGFFTFDVPLVYGTSEITLKYYGPYGEERSKERTILIPYMFLPQGEIEYSITAGVVDDQENSRFSKGEFNYGINRYMTVGAGIEYLSSIPNRNNIPFVKASVTPHPFIIISGEYDHEVVSRGKLSFRNKKNWFIEADLAKYRENQKAILYNYLEERKITTSIPYNLFLIKGFTRLSYKQNIYSDFNYNSAEFTFSANFGRLNTNLSAYGNWITLGTPYVSTNIAAGYRLGRNFHLRGQSMIDVTNFQPINFKIELDRRIFNNGYLNFQIERNFRMGITGGEITFRYDFPFAQTNLSGRYHGNKLSNNLGARGSLAFGGGDGYVHASNRSQLARGGIVFEPFLDINHNMVKDPSEPRVSGLGIRINGGKILSRVSDTLIRVVELEPYTSYLAEIDPKSIENISWQVPDKRMSIFIDPNQFKHILVPVQPMGEINGMVSIQKNGTLRGIGRILVNVYTDKGTLVTRVLTESSGNFTYLGLKPGNYYILPDPVQQGKIRVTSQPERIDFEIKMDHLGDIIDGLDFVLVPVEETSLIPPVEVPAVTERISDTIPEKVISPIGSIEESTQPSEDLSETVKVTDSTQVIEQKTDSLDVVIVVTGNLDPWSGEFFVQVGAFPNERLARQRLREISKSSSWTSGIVLENGLYKVRVGYFTSKKEAHRCLDEFSQTVTDAFIGRQSVYPAAVIRLETQPSGLMEGKYFVQAGAFPTEKQALKRLQLVKNAVNYPTEIIVENGLYKVRLGYFSKKSDAENCYKQLIEKGIEAFIGKAK